MTYEEFLKGTNCKRSTHNYGVFEAVEALYMLSEDMSKEEAYKLGKRFIDNSPTEEERRMFEEIRQSVHLLEWDAQHYREEAERMSTWAKEAEGNFYPLYYRSEAKRYRQMAEKAEADIKTYHRLLPEAFEG